MVGVSNNSKQWIEEIFRAYHFFLLLQVDDKQPNSTASMSPRCDPFSEYYQSDWKKEFTHICALK